MHCEKNLAENIIKTIFGEKDTLKVRRDLELLGMRPELWLQRDPDRADTLIMPPAPYVLTEAELQVFLEIVQNLKVPTGYASAFKKHVVKKKLSGMKSHDYHVLMQQIIPLAIRGLMPSGPRRAILRVCRVFKKLCAKVVNPVEYEELRTEAVLTLCLIEKEFPPSFFDVMTHLVVHLVDELYLCGPVASRWMYPMERAMKDMKGYVRNMARPEGSMAEGYQFEEALGFCTEYMAGFDGSVRRVWDADEAESVEREVVEGSSKARKLNDLCDIVHEYIIQNHPRLSVMLG